MMFQLFSIFLVPLVLSLFITPFVIRFAKKVGAMDAPNERKIHKFPIPRLGGLAIYISFFLSLLMYYGTGDQTMHLFSSMNPNIGMLAVSLTLVLMLGIWDDIRPLSPGKKFIGQSLAAAIVYVAGFRISSITHPLSANLLDLGMFDFPATILWVVGITNAFNLIDGLDGLAAGVAFIVSLTISTISFLKGDLAIAVMALLLAGSVLGFLRYNFNGARIFLGDSGSLFIGFLLAILSMLSSTKGSAAFSILIPVLALGLPIMDTLLSMIRRLVRSIFPEQKESKSIFGKMLTLFLPDRGHIHHQLIARGLSHRAAVLLLYVVSGLFGVGAFAVTATNNIGATPILVAIGIATFIGVSQLRYKEMAVLRNGILLPLYEWPLMNSNLFQGFLDIAFIVIAYMGASYFALRAQVLLELGAPFFNNIALVCGVQLGLFYLSGLYKGTFRQLGIADILKIFKTVTLSVLVTWVVLAFFAPSSIIVNFNLMILDFYFLLSLVLGARVSFHVLNYLSRLEHNSKKKKALIYGADARGALISQQILNDEKLNLCPIGFLDENPRLERKRLNGYPIFGGHWKLRRLSNKMHIDEVIITSDGIMPEVQHRILAICRERGIMVRSYQVHLDEVQTISKSIQPKQERFVMAEK